MALKTDPEKYGAALPQVSGYTYTESDREEYIQAYSLSSNDTIRNEVNGMDQSLLSIKNKKIPIGTSCINHDFFRECTKCSGMGDCS